MLKTCAESLFFVAVATALTLVVISVHEKTPFLFLLLAILLSASRNGWLGGALVTGMGAVAAVVVLGTGYSDWSDLLPLALYCGVGAAFSVVLERLRSSQEALRSVNAKLFQDIRERERAEQRLELLARAARHLLTSDDPRNMVRGLYEIVAEHLRADGYFNFLVNQAGDALQLESCTGIPDEVAATIRRLDFGQAVCGTVAMLRKPIMATEIQSSDDPKVQLVRGYGIRAYACNPLFAGERLIGTLSFASRRRDRFDADELEFMRTISHYVELAMERVQLTRDLRQANQTLNAVVDNSPLPIWAVDRQGAVKVWNPAAERVFGWSRQEVVGRELPASPEVSPAEAQLPMERVYAGETVIGWEAPRRTSTGRRLVTSASMAPLRDATGEITGVLAIVADITEQKTLDEQLRETQKLESIGILAGGVAHDFNNLLVGILGGASLAAEMTSDAELKAIMEDVARAGERAADLTRQLLAYAGKGRFVVTRFSLADAVRETVRLVQASISKRVEIRLELDPEAPLVEGDRTQIQQVIMNLTLNAAEAAEGKEHPTVIITAGGSGDYAMLTVQDNGCGMDEETRRRIFDPFFTTKFSGRGLGLSAVVGILRSQKGRIQVESAPGQGSRFTVLLPAAEAAVEEARRAPAAVPRGHGTVLVVDDEPAVQKFATACLKRYGYHVISAMDGREALRILDSGRSGIGLIILDLTMPVMGGEQVLRVVRRRHARIPVILTSGHTESEARKRFGEGAPDAYLVKPFRAADLAAKVTEVMGNTRAAVRG